MGTGEACGQDDECKGSVVLSHIAKENGGGHDCLARKTIVADMNVCMFE